MCAIATYDPSITRAAGNDNAPIFCGRVGDENGFCINQAEPLQQELVGTSQTKDAEIRRIKWYHGFAAYDKYSLAVLTGVNPSE